MKEKINLIVNRLKELIPNKNNYHKKLFEAANYSLQGDGKRMRPLIVLLVVEALKKDFKLALDSACAIELIHTYSLIHDDLPCMDDDDIRRGKPSLHRAYPQWLAVLTGDYLLTYAFEIIANEKKLEAKQKINLIQTLTKYAGGNGLIAGQIADLSWESKNIDFKKLEFMHFNKTASLFIASVEFGCIIAKATQDVKEKFLGFAKNLGLAFQIFNDIKGFYKTSDLVKKKATAISLLGLDKAKKIASDLQEKSLYLLKTMPYEMSYLEKIVEEISV
jgi:geranylgeranyl diphosphate synthase type II